MYNTLQKTELPFKLTKKMKIPTKQRKLDGLHEPSENGKIQTFWIQMRKNKPLDESRKTCQTSGTKMAFYSNTFMQSTILKDLVSENSLTKGMNVSYGHFEFQKTPAAAGFIPLPIVFSPLLVLQGAGVVFSASKLVDECIKLPHTGPHTGRLLDFSSETHDCFGFLYGGYHSQRLSGWWYTDEESREEQARLYHAGATGYNTFCGYPPEVVKKMPKKALTEEVCRLQAALCEHTEITIISQQEYETLQNEKVLCRVCYERELNVVLLPCRHWVLCSKCSEKCKKCPICRVNIDERLLVHDT